MNKIFKNNIPPVFVTIMVITGVIFGAFAGPFIKLLLANNMQPVWIAALRMILTTVIMIPAVLISKKSRIEYRNIKIKDFKFILLSGFFLAGHFFCLMSALKYTTTFGTIVIMTSNLVFISIMELVFLKENPGKIVLIVIFSSIIGTAIIGWSDLTNIGNMKGTLYAVIGSPFAAAYMVTGRHVRKKYTLITYTSALYATAALLLALYAILLKTQFKMPDLKDFGLLMGLVILSTLLCHTVFNWALKYKKASFISIMFLAQPFLVAVLAFILYLEIAAINVYIGGLVIIAGIFIYLMIKRKEEKKETELIKISDIISD